MKLKGFHHLTAVTADAPKNHGFYTEVLGLRIDDVVTLIRGAKDSSGNFENTGGMAKEFGKDGFEVYAGDDGLLLDLMAVGGAGCITAASNITCAVNQEVYSNWNNPKGTEAQTRLSAARKAVISVPLIPGLKALKARHTGDTAWHNIRPPHLRLDAAQQATLFSNFDACAITLATAA